MKEPRTVHGGLVVIFEGLDGVGKTTQLQLAAEALKGAGWGVHTTRNLGGSTIGEELRKVILSPLPRPAMTDLYIGAAVQEALAIEIKEKRHMGQIVLLDRGPMSLAAYTLGDQDMAWSFADDGIKKFSPDLIIYYALDLDKAAKRIDSRGKAKNYFENKPRSHYEKVQSSLEKGAKRYSAESISADSSIEHIHSETMAKINNLLTT